MKARRKILLWLVGAATILIAALCCPSLAAAEDAGRGGGFFRLKSAVTLPGKDPDWDYLAYDQVRGRLFIARRDAGLWVFDTRRQRLIRKIGSTHGAGATLLLPHLNRGFAINEDGSLTAFNLATLVPLRRFKVAEDADAASFDPVSGRIAVVSSDSRRMTFVDPRTFAVIGSLPLQTAKADGSVPDGRGAILLNERDRNAVLKVDAASMTVAAEWPIAGCGQPTGIAYDTAAHRAFVGCRGDHPVLAVINADTGATVTTLPIGRGNDCVVFDSLRRRVFTTNGVDANLVIFHQDGPDHYRMEQAITTRPQARTMAYDPIGQRVFSVAAEGYLDPSKPANLGPSNFYPNFHFPDTFVVLSYAEEK